MPAGQFGAEIVDVEQFRQPGIGRHDRGRHDCARIGQMLEVPAVGIFAAEPQARSGPVRLEPQSIGWS